MGKLPETTQSIIDCLENSETNFLIELLVSHSKTLCKTPAYKEAEISEKENYPQLQKFFNYGCTINDACNYFERDIEKLHIATHEGFINIDTSGYDNCGGLFRSHLFGKERQRIKPYICPDSKIVQPNDSYGHELYELFFNNAITVSKVNSKTFLLVDETNFFFAPKNQIELFRVLKVLKTICKDLNSKI